MNFWNFRDETDSSVDLYIKGMIESDDNWIKEWYESSIHLKISLYVSLINIKIKIR